MASRSEENQPQPRESDQARSLIYMPCPACGRGVRLFDENRVRGECDLYLCPNCGCRFAVSTDDP